MEKTIEKLKNIEVNILKEFIHVCEKYQLKYYLLGGTMLGAIRHSGFIPWDDDIDVGMPRDDYEKFLLVGQKELSGNLFVQTRKTDQQVLFCYCKIRDTNTTFLETSVKNHNINHGIFIDVFPLDFYPSNGKKQKKFQKKKRFYNLIIGSRYSSSKKGKRKILNLLIKAFSIVYPIQRAIRKRDLMYKTQDDKSLMANNGGAWGEKEIVPTEWYGNGVIMQFEGVDVVVPERYDLWLTQVYGADYMQLPPEEKRVTHHYTEIIDTEKSYKEYFKT